MQVNPNDLFGGGTSNILKWLSNKVWLGLRIFSLSKDMGVRIVIYFFPI